MLLIVVLLMAGCGLGRDDEEPFPFFPVPDGAVSHQTPEGVVYTSGSVVYVHEGRQCDAVREAEATTGGIADLLGVPAPDGVTDWEYTCQ